MRSNIFPISLCSYYGRSFSEGNFQSIPEIEIFLFLSSCTTIRYFPLFPIRSNRYTAMRRRSFDSGSKVLGAWNFLTSPDSSLEAKFLARVNAAT